MMCALKNSWLLRVCLGILVLHLIFTGAAQAIDQWEDGIVRNYTSRDFDVDALILGVSQDRRGLMYYATSRGVLEYDSSTWRLIRVPGGAFSLVCDEEGRIYVGGDGDIGYLAPSRDGKMEYLSLQDQVGIEDLKAYGPVLESLRLPTGELLFLFEKLLLRYGPGGFSVIPTDGNLYKVGWSGEFLYLIDSDEGLMRLRDNQLEPIAEGNFFLAHALIPHSDGRLLLITQDKGVLLYNPQMEDPENLKTPDREAFSTLPIVNGEIFENRLVTAVFQVSQNVFLLGVEELGVVRLDLITQSAKVLDKLLLENSSIFSIFQDSKGYSWFANRRGVTVFFPGASEAEVSKEVEMFLSARPARNRGDEQFTALIRRIETTADEKVLFEGNFFEEFRGIPTINESELTFIELPFERNALRITFASNDFVHPGDVRYQSLLDGMDESWSKWSRRPFREYTNLTWKEYSFQVRAMNKEGVQSQPVSFTFSVSPPWYETWWFYAGQIGFLLLLLLASGILRSMGYSDSLSDYIVALVVLVIFAFLDASFIEPYIDDLAEDSLYVKVILLIAMGMLIEPLQTLARNQLGKIHLSGYEGTALAEDRDTLTNLANRAYFTRRAEAILQRTVSKQQMLSLAMFDIDHFGRVNDAHGFDVGDAVLRDLARVLRKNERRSDLFGRFEGEKFVLVMPGLDTRGALEYCKKLAESVGQHVFHYDNTDIRLTLSIGLASYPEVCAEEPTLENMLKEVELARDVGKDTENNSIHISPNTKNSDDMQRIVRL
jgi:diguanylate cyclase (GGDEF)-like protein